MIGDLVSVPFKNMVDPEYIKEKIMELCSLLNPEDKAALLEMMEMDSEYNIKPAKED